MHPLTECAINLHQCLYLWSEAWIIGQFTSARNLSVEGKQVFSYLIHDEVYSRSMFKWNWAEKGDVTIQVRLMRYWLDKSVDSSESSYLVCLELVQVKFLAFQQAMKQHQQRP